MLERNIFYMKIFSVVEFGMYSINERVARDNLINVNDEIDDVSL